MLNRQQQEQQLVTVGHAIAAFLEACEVKAAFGVISIHNMPILDGYGAARSLRRRVNSTAQVSPPAAAPQARPAVHSGY